MYSERLERMIKMALMDGAMDESDRQVINKAALEEGVDLDELDLYIRSLIKKLKTHDSVIEEIQQETLPDSSDKDSGAPSPKEQESSNHRKDKIIESAKDGAAAGLAYVFYELFAYKHFYGLGIFGIVLWVLCLPFILFWRSLELIWNFFF